VDSHTGTLIEDLFASVEQAEKNARIKTAVSSAECEQMVPTEAITEMAFSTYKPNNSRNRFVCARLTGISLCFLSSIRNW
jgi:hypothetical protein